MSVVVTCIIKVEEQKYGGLSKDMDIFEVKQHNASSSNFASTPKEIIDSMIESSVETASKNAHDKLEVIKGAK